MSNLKLKILDREYIIGCAEGQEPRLLSLSASIDRRLREVRAAAPASTDATIMVMLMLMQADEIYDIKQDLEKLRSAASNLLDSKHGETQMSLDYAAAETIDKAADRLEAVAISHKKR